MKLETVAELDRLQAKTFAKYGPIRGNYDGLGALQLEFDEVKQAVQARDYAHLRAELLDVVNVALRWIETLDGGIND